MFLQQVLVLVYPPSNPSRFNKNSKEFTQNHVPRQILPNSVIGCINSSFCCPSSATFVPLRGSASVASLAASTTPGRTRSSVECANSGKCRESTGINESKIYQNHPKITKNNRKQPKTPTKNRTGGQIAPSNTNATENPETVAPSH